MGSRVMAATAGAVAIALGVTGVVVLGGGGDDGPPSTIAPSVLGAPDGTVLAAGLEHPTSCEDLAATMRELREARYGENGATRAAVFGGTTTADGVEEMAADDAADFDSGGALPATDEAFAAEGAGGGEDSTNVQEAGVDEPDMVERVGDLVVVGTEGVVRTLAVRDGTPVELGRLELQQWGGDLGLFAIGADRVVALSQGHDDLPVRPLDDGARSMVRPAWDATTVVLVDVSDPAAPVELSRARLEGSLVDARAVSGVLRVAVRSGGPQIDIWSEGGELQRLEEDFDWENATEADHRAFEQRMNTLRTELETEALAQIRPTDWQPHAAVTTASGASTVQPLVACDRVGFPVGSTADSLLTMTAIDATGDALVLGDAEAVAASGETLYATADRMVVATTRWAPCCDDVPAEEPPVDEPVEPFFEEGDAPAVEQPDQAPEEEAASDALAATLPMIEPIMPWPGGGPGASTDLHVFDVDGTVVSHVSSGNVRGTLVNQYAMSIHDGVLRAATTDWEDGSSESYVTTLRVEGTELVQLGQVGDLGPDEDIQAVRFMGPTAYVVTFRRTDPLYVVDLSDPTAPTTRGELKIEGYSAYLHPLDQGRLLGVGQDADPETGRTRGVQVSTFDVTDPTRPTRIDVDVTPDSSTEVEWEPHALTVTDDRLVVLPIEQWAPRGGQTTLGALVYRVEADGQLTRVGLLNSGSNWLLRPRRTVALDDVLLTVGDRGAIAWDRGTFAVAGTLEFTPPSFEGDGMREELDAMAEERGGTVVPQPELAPDAPVAPTP